MQGSLRKRLTLWYVITIDAERVITSPLRGGCWALGDEKSYSCGRENWKCLVKFEIFKGKYFKGKIFKEIFKSKYQGPTTRYAQYLGLQAFCLLLVGCTVRVVADSRVQ